VRIFRDRQEAGKRLAWELRDLKGQRPLILGVPPGGVLMGARMREELGGDLDVALVARVRSPVEGERSLGALGEGAEEPVWNGRRRPVRPDPEWLLGELNEQRRCLDELRSRYTPGRGPLAAAGRIVVVVDEGIETGATMQAVLRVLRQRGPARVIVAAAVGLADGLLKLESEADRVVALQSPEAFGGLAQFFGELPAVSEEALISALRQQPSLPR
jgi:putative phosphoribosyl transferase